jgi:hypothetical protein
VVNDSVKPVSYSIKATEWAETGQPITINNVTYTPASTNNPVATFCITWNSLPGVHYYVEAVPDLIETNWTTISPTITAVTNLTTFCIDLPSPFHFFRVKEGIALSTYFPPPTLSIVETNSGYLLTWNGPTNLQYNVQWAPDLPPTWNTVAPPVTSTNGLFEFFDDGTQTAPLGPQRFYRVEQVP